MRTLKTGITVGLALLGLSAAPAQAFGPMMLLMLPMMIGGQHAMGTHGAGAEQQTHASHAPQPQALAPASPDMRGTAESEALPGAAGNEAKDAVAPAK